MKKKLIGVSVAAALAVALGTAGVAGCGNNGMKLDDAALEAPIVADYTKTAAERAETFASGSKGFSWENGEPFNVWWKPENVSYEGGKLSLALSEMGEKPLAWDEETKTNVPCVAEYYGAEERSEHYYGYGDFEVRMKPAKIVGTASTFFSCTGNYDKWYTGEFDEEGKPVVARSNDHDEIDIEFLGKDTTKVQFNYFATGVGGHEYMYDLGFDASLEFHNYGYRWTAESITWFVDGTPVYKVERKNIKSGEDWPEEPGRLIMNYWCGTQKAAAWMGNFNDDYTGHAEYEWVRCSATPAQDPNLTEPKPQPKPDEGGTLEVPASGWTDISYDGFDGWGMYTVDKTAGLTISHDADVSGYKCCGMSLAESYSWIKCKIKNNATETADLRIDAKKEGGVGGVDDAAVNGEKVAVNGDAAAVFQIAAGEEVELALKIKDMYIDQLVVFLNSAGSGFATAGNITVTDLKGIVNSGAEKPEEPEKPELPEAPEGWTSIDLSGFDGWGKYTVDKTNGVKISHTAAIETYGCCGADVTFGANNTAHFKVTNNSATEAAAVKLCIKNDNNATAAIKSATVNGVAVDYVEYGALAVIAAGESAEFVIIIDVAQKADKFVVSFNSEADGTMATSGDITITEAYFKVDGSIASPEEEQPGQPSGDWTAMDVTEMAGAAYTVDKTDGLKISHSAAVAQYSNCNMGVTYTEENNKVKFNIKNNAEVSAVVKVGAQELVSYRNVVSEVTVDGVAKTDVEWGVCVTLAAGAEVEIIIVVDLAKNPKNIFVALNSEDASGNAATGDVTVAISYTGVKVEDPQPAGAWTALDVSALSTWDGDYTVTTEGGVKISHAKEIHTAYVNCNMDVNLDATCSIIKLVIKNEGTEPALVKAGVQNATYACVLSSATIDGTATDVTYGAITTVAVGAEVEIIMYVNLAAAPVKLFIALNSEGAIGTNAATGCISVQAYTSAPAAAEAQA